MSARRRDLGAVVVRLGWDGATELFAGYESHLCGYGDDDYSTRARWVPLPDSEQAYVFASPQSAQRSIGRPRRWFFPGAVVVPLTEAQS